MPLSFDNLGDETIAFRLSSDAEGMPVTVDMVMWNRRPVLSVVRFAKGPPGGARWDRGRTK